MPRRIHRHTTRPASRVVKKESRAQHLLSQNKSRLDFLRISVALAFAVLAVRLIEVSLIGGGQLPFQRLVAEPHLLVQAQEDSVSGREVSARDNVSRRLITDRNGLLLAANVPTASLAANPQLIRQPNDAAQKLSRVLEGVSAERLAKSLSDRDSRFSWIKRHLTPAEQKAVTALGIPGLFLEHAEKRIYPSGNMMSHLLGYTDVDNRGLSGIEKQYDAGLRSWRQEDGPLQLSVDLRVQHIMYASLQKAMKRFSATGAAGVMADAHTGEIISMVSLPDFDPHQPMAVEAKRRFNRVTLGTYELGSAFKTFTVAQALDTGAVRLHDAYDTSKPIRYASHKISDYHAYYRPLNVTEIFAYSSNIGTVQLLQQTGFDRQKKFMKQLGFFDALNLDFPETARPQYPKEWKDIQAMTISYGHGISVTPLHLSRAIAAMVNGGTLHDMQFLKRDDTPKGTKVISEDTSRQVREMMRQVVEYGTARKAQVAGYRVGGKTGTADKIVDGRYAKDKRIASFVSAFPIRDPKYVLFVMVDEPKGRKDTHGYATGGWVAAPVAAEVIAQAGPLLGVAPDQSEPDLRETEFWERSRKKNYQARQARFNRGSSPRVHAAAY